LADGVGEEQEAADVAILAGGDVDVGGEAGDEQAYGAAVDVIDAGDEEDERDDDPAESGNFLPGRVFSIVHLL